MKKNIIYLIFLLSNPIFSLPTPEPNGEVVIYQDSDLEDISGKTLVISQEISLTSTRTINKNTTLRFVSNGKISLGIYDLELNGSIDASMHQIFNCNDVGEVRGTPNVEYVVPQWFGANISDPDYDNKNAIQMAINLNKTTYLPAGTYGIKSPIELHSNSILIGDAKILSKLILYEGDNAIVVDNNARNISIKNLFLGNYSGNSEVDPFSETKRV